MVKFYRNNKITALIVYGFLFLSNTEGMETYEHLNDFNKTDINHQTVKLFLERNVDTYRKLIDSSVNKDIVVFLGNTGAGKSTLINYLNGKPMRCTGYQKIELINSHDQDVMEIGNNDQSHTLLPKSTFIIGHNLLFYDLPGFHDNRGGLINLLNASFIKNIIETARSTRCVFVSGLDETTAERGASIKQLFKISQSLMPGQSIENISSLIITKSLEGDIGELLDILETKCPEATALWRGNRRVSHLYQARKGDNLNDQYQYRDPIINLIVNTRATKIDNVNIGVVYSDQDQGKLLEVFKQEIIEISKRIIQTRMEARNEQSGNTENITDVTRNYNSPYASSSAYGASSPELGILQAEKSFYENNAFLKEVVEEFNASKLTCLLKPIAEYQYHQSVFDLEETIKPHMNEQILNISGEIRKIEAKKSQMELEGERKKRQEAERKAEEQRLRQAEEREEREEREREREREQKKLKDKAKRKKQNAKLERRIDELQRENAELLWQQQQREEDKRQRELAEQREEDNCFVQ